MFLQSIHNLSQLAIFTTQVLAADIPLKTFLPSADNQELREWLAWHVKKSLVKHLPVFQRQAVKPFIEHAHWVELTEKSEVVSYFLFLFFIPALFEKKQ
jgi:hypothetical protein